MKNVVQAEFFHVTGSNNSTLEAIICDCVERAIDGVAIKTVVRFTDETGKLMKMVVEEENLRKRYQKLLDDYSREIAIEKRDHLFRYPHKDELHELVEAASKATRVWLFVLKPTHLLSVNGNELVASAM